MKLLSGSQHVTVQNGIRCLGSGKVILLALLKRFRAAGSDSLAIPHIH